MLIPIHCTAGGEWLPIEECDDWQNPKNCAGDCANCDTKPRWMEKTPPEEVSARVNIIINILLIKCL